MVLDLKDYERALVWIDRRFSHVLAPGLYAYWTALKDVKVEVVDARKVRVASSSCQIRGRMLCHEPFAHTTRLVSVQPSRTSLASRGCCRRLVRDP